MKELIILFTLSYFFTNAQMRDSSRILSFETIPPELETDPVISSDDAADDVCIWYNPKDSNRSIVVGTDKKWGLISYALNGSILSKSPFGKINNIDIYEDFSYQGGAYPLLFGSNRSEKTIDIYRLFPDGKLQRLNQIKVPELREVYGITFYGGEQHRYVFLSDKKGRIQQWMFGLRGDLPDLKLLRTLKVKSTVEGMVADEHYEKLYIAEENKGLWEVNVLPWKDKAFQLLIATDKDQLLADFEGITLMERPNGEGMIFISIQGNNAYGVVDRKSKKFLGGFRIGNNNDIDAVDDTDGIDLATFSSRLFPQGVFIAQDGYNGAENQNYKFVDLGRILDYINQKP